jgi:hypothetical protein
MPRKSAEALAGAWFRAQQQYGASGRPKPPAWLHAEAKKDFAAIVNSRAPDLFSPGNLELLAHYCHMGAIATTLWQRHAELPMHDPRALRLQRMALRLVATMCTLATNLALLPRHTHGRRSGVLSEIYPAGDNVLPWQKHV